MDPCALLEHIAAQYRGIVGDNLVGVYVHGSLAFGCFHPGHSDIDFLVVVERTPSLNEKQALLRVLLDTEDQAPAKGLEMSVVRAAVCRPFVYPTPFELHYSAAHRAACRADPAAYCASMQGVDPDLAAHVTVLRRAGRVVWGRPIAAVFGDVPPEAYRDSLRRDSADACELVGRYPVDVVLNLCRGAAFEQEGAVLSKAQGGDWGRRRLPARFAPLIARAACCYRQGVGGPLDPGQCRDFCRYMLAALGLPSADEG